MPSVDSNSLILFIYRSPNTPEDGNAGGNQVISEFSSTVTEVLSEKNMNVQGKKKASRNKRYSNTLQKKEKRVHIKAACY